MSFVFSSCSSLDILFGSTNIDGKNVNDYITKEKKN